MIPTLTDTIIVTTTTLHSKHTTLSTIYSNLTKEPDPTFIITQDSNTIKIFHKVSPDLKVLIRTYIVIIIPVLIDLSPITNLTGNLTFCLDETVEALNSLLFKLQSLQGHRQIRGAGNDTILERLDKILYGITGKY